MIVWQSVYTVPCFQSVASFLCSSIFLCHSVKGGQHINLHCGLSSQAKATNFQTNTQTHIEQQIHKESVYTCCYHSIIAEFQFLLSKHSSDNVALPLHWTMYPLPHWCCYLQQTKQDCVHLQHVEAAVPKQKLKVCQQRVSPLLTNTSSNIFNPNNMEDYRNSEWNRLSWCIWQKMAHLQ